MLSPGVAFKSHPAVVGAGVFLLVRVAAVLHILSNTPPSIVFFIFPWQ